MILKKYNPQIQILAFDIDTTALTEALEEKIADICFTALDTESASHFGNCDFLFLCAPVSKNDENLKLLKSYLSEDYGIEFDRRTFGKAIDEINKTEEYRVISTKGKYSRYKLEMKYALTQEEILLVAALIADTPQSFFNSSGVRESCCTIRAAPIMVAAA